MSVAMSKQSVWHNVCMNYVCLLLFSPRGHNILFNFPISCVGLKITAKYLATGHRYQFNIYSMLVQHHLIEMTWKQR
jgi:hypothetical protein